MKKHIIFIITIVLICNNTYSQYIKNVGSRYDTTISFTPTTEISNEPSQYAPSGPGDRYVYWIHGLGGNQASWLMSATASARGVQGFPARKIESITEIKYDESITNFNTAIHSLQQIIHSKRPLATQSDRLNDFIITHSQGGLVSRYLDKDLNTGNPANYYRDFNGIVTFSTPHGGAKIIDNVQNTNLVTSFFDDACKALTIGPVREGLGGSFAVKLFGIDKIADEFSTQMCQAVGLFGNTFAKIYTGDLGLEYQTTSSTITSLKNYNTPTNKVCFYGIANNKGIAFDILYSYSIKGANNYGHFQAGNSTADAKVEANNTINKYKEKAMQCHKWSEWEWGLLPPRIIFSWGEGPIYYELYMQGVNFIKNADERWLDIIGSRHVNYYYKTGYNCVDINNVPVNNPNNSTVCLKKMYNVSFGDDDPNEETPTNPCIGFPGTTPVYYTILVSSVNYIESDGIVLTNSSSAFTGAVHKIPLINSNHEQIKNDLNTKDALNKLYNGDYGLYFKTDPR